MTEKITADFLLGEVIKQYPQQEPLSSLSLFCKS